MECPCIASTKVGPDDKPQKRHGVVLTENKAYEIYKLKFHLDKSKLKGRGVPVSRKFNVSPKTVRDIWSRRTWINATKPLWSAHEVLLKHCTFHLVSAHSSAFENLN